MSNPYQSPPSIEHEPSHKPKSVALRGLAILFWVLGIQPTLLIATGLLTEGVPEELTSTPFGLPELLGLSLALLAIWVLPTSGFTLLGLGSWRRSWRLAVAGALVVVGDIVVVGLIVVFVPRP